MTDRTRFILVWAAAVALTAGLRVIGVPRWVFDTFLTMSCALGWVTAWLQWHRALDAEDQLARMGTPDD